MPIAYKVNLQTKSKKFLCWSKEVQIYQVVKVTYEICVKTLTVTASFEIVSEHKGIKEAFEKRNELNQLQNP